MISHELPLDMPERMLVSLDRVENEPVVVHLGNHPYNNHTLEKREKQLREGGNPFIDAASWKEFIESMRQKTKQKMKENKELFRVHMGSWPAVEYTGDGAWKGEFK